MEHHACAVASVQDDGSPCALLGINATACQRVGEIKVRVCQGDGPLLGSSWLASGEFHDLDPIMIVGTAVLLCGCRRVWDCA